MLRNSLSSLDIKWRIVQSNFSMRPEQLTIEDFIEISNNIIS
ncbi:MAG: hypothetical protein Ct9H90mP15_00300 [Candidatus Neomarinimicrobiota bacterium]|nr:MAG: hypothetical protein Ct9H90mP15_00300 [Candidatus Neomarinimicrobiota bacterium]